MNPPPPPTAEKPRLTDVQKKQNHILSEQKRREAIRRGFDSLAAIVPNMAGQGRSEALVLSNTVKYLESEMEKKERLVQRARGKGVEGREIVRAYGGKGKERSTGSGNGSGSGSGGGGSGGGNGNGAGRKKSTSQAKSGSEDEEVQGEYVDVNNPVSAGTPGRAYGATVIVYEREEEQKKRAKQQQQGRK
ncbi:hypothetical protein LTR08_000560 [Meristemomyces frigidus]|nr:hypothetical protein LTR08_000560 [Meristemomyces frigidus]